MNIFRVYMRIVGLVFLGVAIQAMAMAETPPRIRAQQQNAIMKLVPNFTSKTQRKQEFFNKDIMGNNERASNLDPKFKKVIIIAGKKKEKSSIDMNRNIPEEIKKISSNFIESIQLKQDDFKKRDSQA